MSFQSAVYGFIPTSITGCQVWLDGVDSSTVSFSSGSNVSSWSDKSGNGRNATVYAGTPTYTSALGMTFNGSSSLQITYTASPTIESMFVIIKFNSVSGQGDILSGTAAGQREYLMYIPYSPGTIYLGRHSTGPSGAINGGTVTTGSNYLLEYVFNGTGNTISFFQSGNTITSGTPQFTYSAGGTISVIGSYNGGGYLQGQIYEMIIYSTALGTTERQQVESYLAQKWGLTSSLPSSHPGRSTTLYRSDYTKQNIMRALPYYTQFTPRQIPGCSHWFDATDSSTITLSSGSLTQWNDKSGNGRNLTAVSGFANATVSSAYQNGLNVFNFSGNGLYRTAAGNVSYPLDVYIIVALKSLTTHVDVLGMGDASVDNFNSLTFAESAASRWHNGSSGGGRQTISTSNETSLSFLLIQWSIANGNYLLRRNGTQLIQASRNYSFNNSATAIFQIGFRHTDNVYGTYANFSGYIGEIIVFNNQIGTTDRQNVESYLAQKWDLTASLPGGHSHATQPAGAITLQSLANKQIVRRRVVYTINWTYTIPSQANLILQVNSRNWTSSASILDSITGVAWNMTNASLNSSRNTILMAGNGLFKYNNAGAGPSGFSGTQHTVMMVYYRLANATSASKGNPPSVTLNLTGYLYTINRTPATITNQLLAGENSSWVYQSAYQVGTNQTVLDGTTGWTFIAFVYTGTALNVYLNGQPENNPNSVSNPATTTLTNNYFSIFGNPRDNNAFINGELAFYGLWNTQLTAQNILDFYNTNKDQFLAFP